MTAINRNNAAVAQHGLGKAQLKGGGDGRVALGLAKKRKVKKKWRHSEDPAAELMPAAEFLGNDPEFYAILEEFEDSPFDPRRRRVLGKLMGIFAMDYQGARAEERRFLKRLLIARNAREGYAANRALHLCYTPSAIRRTLALGVAESRFDPGPSNGFLGAVQARVAATTLALLGPQGRREIWDALLQAGLDEAGNLAPGADAVLERAVILKALGSRRHRVGPWSAEGAVALQEISNLAASIRGLPRIVLAARTTLIPGDPDRVAARIREQTNPVLRTALVARGDLDPIFAWHLHGGADEEEDLNAGDLGSVRELESFEELPEQDRNPLLDRSRWHQALAEARLDQRIDPPEREALYDYLAGRELSDTRLQYKDAAITKVVDGGFDVGDPAVLDLMRDDAKGTYKFDAARALGELLSRYTGAMYVRRVFSDQLTAGSDPLGQIKLALRNGFSIPLTIRELRAAKMTAWMVTDAREVEGVAAVDIHEPPTGSDLQLAEDLLMAPQLPAPFGRRARADTYLAPAALDLLAPPFGIPFPELGIEDRL